MCAFWETLARTALEPAAFHYLIDVEKSRRRGVKEKKRPPMDPSG